MIAAPLLIAAIQGAIPVAAPSQWIPAFLEGSRALEHGDAALARDRFRSVLQAMPEHAASTYALACALARSGDREGAFQYLQLALQRGYSDEAVMAWDPDLVSLHEDERFGALLHAMHAAAKSDGLGEWEVGWNTGGFIFELSPGSVTAAIGRGWLSAMRDVASGEVLATLEKPGERTSCLDISPDGRWTAVTGSIEKLGANDPSHWLRIHDCATGDLVRELNDPGWEARVAFSTDGGSLLVLPSAQGSGVVYDTKTWSVRSRVPEGTQDAEISADGSRLILLEREDNEASTFVIWNVEDQKPVRAQRHIATIPMTEMSMSKDGARGLFLENIGHALRIYDARTGDEIRVIERDGPKMIGACFLGKSGEVAEIDEKQTVRIHDASTGEVRRQFEASSGEFYHKLESSPDGSVLLVAGWGIPQEAFDVASGRRLWSTSDPLDPPYFMTFSTDGAHLLLPQSRRGSDVIDPSTGEVELRFEAAGLESVPCKHPQRNEVWLGCSDGSVRRIDGDTGRLLGSWRPSNDLVRVIAISSDGAHVASVDDQGNATVIADQTGAIEGRFSDPPEKEHRWRTPFCEFSPDGSSLIVGGASVPPTVLTMPACKTRFILDVKGTAWKPVWSPDGRQIALSLGNGRVSLCNGERGSREGDDIQLEGEVTVLAYAPGGKTLWVGTDKSKVQVLDIASKTWIRTLDHAGLDPFEPVEIGSITFKNDGKLVVTASSGFGVVAAWDPSTAKKLWSFEYDGGNPVPLLTEFSADGETIYVHGQGPWSPRIVAAKDGKTIVDLGRRELDWIAPSHDGKHIFAYGSRGTECLDASGARLWSRIETKEQEGLISSSNGYLDGPTTTLEKLQGMLVTRSYPLEALAAELLDPKRVRAAAAGVTVLPPRAPEIPTLDWSLPTPRVLTLSGKDQSVDLGLDAKCAGGVSGFEVREGDRIQVLGGTRNDDGSRHLELVLPHPNKDVASLEVRCRAISARGVLSRALHLTIRRSS